MNERYILGFLLLCLAGCSPNTLTITGNGISYELPFQKETAPDPGVDTLSTDKTPHTGFAFNGASITIKELDGNLTVNGKDFGAVKSGDKVRITNANEIFINGTSRTPK